LIQVCFCAAILAGCATEQKAPEKADAAAKDQPEQVVKNCGEPITGSNLRRCDRAGVQTMSREDYERQIPGGPGLTRALIKSGN